MTEPRSEKANNMARGRRLFEETQTKEGRDTAKKERDAAAGSNVSAGARLYERTHPKKEQKK